MLCTWISFSAPDMHADTKLHTQPQPPTMKKKKKSVVGTRGSFLHQQKSKHTKENSLPFSPQEYTTSKCHRWGRPGLYWDWCETTFPLWYTIRWWGARGFAWTATRCEVHLCLRCCGAWPLRLWRRWISYRCLCQHGPITNQMHMRAGTCTGTHTHLHTYTKACIETNVHP